ncbi:Nepenthesin [Bertholletia excelsa]
MACSVFFVFLSCLMTCFAVSDSELLLLPLTHSLSASHFNSTPHLLKSTAARSAARHHRRRTKQQQQRQVSLPLSSGSDYTLSISLGYQTVTLYLDTGSDVVWLPCHPFDCILCEGKFDPSVISTPTTLKLSSSASPATCKSRACAAAHSSPSSSDLCAASKCPLETIETSDCKAFPCPPFYYAYADGSLIANLYADTLTIPMSAPQLILRNFSFGCAHTALGEPVGVAGFGRGVLSLPAQLAGFSSHLGSQFSYCLVSHSFDSDRVRRPSPLILGRNEKRKQSGQPEAESQFVYTPMLHNAKHPYFYSVGLEAVSVGKRRIPAPDSLKRVDGGGNGGMVVDSGTTFTILPSELYGTVVVEFEHRVGRVHKRADRIEESTGLSPCYYLDGAVAKVAALALHFAGNSSVVLPRGNFFYEFLDGGDDGKGRRKVGCLMLMDGGNDAEGGPVGTLGNYQQQGFEVVYDLEKQRVGFARRECESLWNSLRER